MIVSIKDMRHVGTAAWDHFVEQHPLGTIYHHSKWHQVIERTYGYKGSYCTVEKDGEVRAALPFVLVQKPLSRRRLVSYPFCDTCDPLVEDAEELDALCNEIERYRDAGRVRAAEIRSYRLALQVPGFVAGNAPGYCNFVLRLDDGEERVFASFHKDCVQRGIRKAGQYRIEIAEGKVFDDMKSFYGLHVRTRKRHGVPPQPLRFFRNLWEAFSPSGMLSVLLARLNGVPVAGIVVLRFKDTVYYKFAAADKGFMVKRPNHLLLWRIVRDAVREGYRYLDLGRTFVEDRGLMRWKTRWGGVPEGMRYLHPADSAEGRFVPEGNRVNIAIGRILKRMPCCAVRMSGELFYKYLA